MGNLKRIYSLLVAGCLVVPVCQGAVVFSDDFSETAGTLMNAKPADVGGIWTETTGLTISSTNSLDTSGAGRLAFNGFTDTLGVGEVLTLSFDTLLPSNGQLVGDGGGWAGVSLYTDYVNSSTPGNERMFIGKPSLQEWGVDGAAGIGQSGSGDSATTNHLVFTYAYDSGAWTFTSESGSLSGSGTVGEAVNGVRVANGSGGDFNIDNLEVTITSVADFSFFGQTPASGSYSVSVTNLISVATTDGASPVDTSSIVMTLDGTNVTPIISKPANVTTITYVPPAPLSEGTLHSVKVTLAEDGGTLHTNAWSFTTGHSSLPVTISGPFAVDVDNPVTILTSNGDPWIGTNYDTNSTETLYTRFSMVFNDLNGETGDGGGYGGLQFYQGNNAGLITGNNWGSTNWSFDAYPVLEELNPTNDNAIVFGEWHTIVIKTEFDPTTNDTVSIWLDPDFSKPESDPVNTERVSLLSLDMSFDNVRLRCGNGTASSDFTNIVMSATAAGVGFAGSVLSIQPAGGSSVDISWTGTSGTLQETTSLLSDEWVDSADQSNPQTRPATNSATFFRIGE